MDDHDYCLWSALDHLPNELHKPLSWIMILTVHVSIVNTLYNVEHYVHIRAYSSRSDWLVFINYVFSLIFLFRNACLADCIWQCFSGTLGCLEKRSKWVSISLATTCCICLFTSLLSLLTAYQHQHISKQKVETHLMKFPIFSLQQIIILTHFLAAQKHLGVVPLPPSCLFQLQIWWGTLKHHLICQDCYYHKSNKWWNIILNFGTLKSHKSIFMGAGAT